MLGDAGAPVAVDVGSGSEGGGGGGVRVGKYSRVWTAIKSATDPSRHDHVDSEATWPSVANPVKSHVLTIWLMVTSECEMQPATWVENADIGRGVF